MGDAFDLSEFGWDNCMIPTDLKNILSFLPSYKTLKTLRLPTEYNGRILYFPHKLTRYGGAVYMPAFEKGDLHMDGGYARIYKARRAKFIPDGPETSGPIHLKRNEPFTEVCIKEVKINVTTREDHASPQTRRQAYKDEIHSILYEAYIHALLYKVMEREGFPSVIPKMYDVVANADGAINTGNPTAVESVWITMEFIHGYTLEKYFQRKLVNLKKNADAAAANQRIIIDVVIQLAHYLRILQDKARFNHRDMKINNIYVRHHDTPWSQKLNIPDFGTWTCDADIVLIDYGFSCIACGEGFPNPRATLLGAGSWFRSEHDCLKYGRDLCQFLYSVHCAFPFHEYVSGDFLTVIHNALHAIKGVGLVDLFRGVDSHGLPNTGGMSQRLLNFNEGIYIFLRERDVEVPGCKPTTFLKNLLPLVPKVLTVELPPTAPPSPPPPPYEEMVLPPPPPV